VISLTIILERSFFWIKESIFGNHELDIKSLKNIDNESFKRKHRDLGGKLIQVLIENRDIKRVEKFANECVQKMKRGMGVLDTIITVSPMLGILGTVFGIITSFNALSTSSQTYSSEITRGISQALVTTEAGLIISIVSIIFYNYFVYRVEKKVREFNELIDFSKEITRYKND